MILTTSEYYQRFSASRNLLPSELVNSPSATRFDVPPCLAGDADGNVYSVDTGSHQVQTVEST